MKRKLDTEYKKLRNSKIPKKAKKKREVEHSIGMYREYYYITRLRKIASLIPDKFFNPSESGVKINRKATKRFYSPRTVKDFKHTIKMFYKWMGKTEVVSWISLSNEKERRGAKILSQRRN
ncbi:MAG: hypothetical protein QW046_02025 [Candidatus Micrarchaeaceae archaeon]